MSRLFGTQSFAPNRLVNKIPFESPDISAFAHICRYPSEPDLEEPALLVLADEVAEHRAVVDERVQAAVLGAKLGYT